MTMIGEERLYTFSEIAAVLPRINGKKIHVSTLHRWCRRGVRGVQLEFRMLGGRMLTSVEAVERFSRQLAECERQPRPYARRSTREDSRRREERINQAQRILDEAGI